jgi:hypothetical protein
MTRKIKKKQKKEKTTKVKVVIKVTSKSLKHKELNCAFEDLSLRCGAIKINLRTCPLQRNMPTFASTTCVAKL